MKRGIIKVNRDKKGEWRWKLLAKNSKVIAVSEGYKTRQGCFNGIKSLHNTIGTGCWIEEGDKPSYVY